MKRLNWQIGLGILLVVLSIAIYLIDYFLFKRAILIYLISDIAFLPVQVLLVTLIVNEILKLREKRALLKKMNMVIGAFFSEVGINLLKSLPTFNESYESIRNKFMVTTTWSDKDYKTAHSELQNAEYSVNSRTGNLDELRQFLIAKREFLLGLLENPNLLEHESFTELLWAVFHLTEELAYRKNINHLSNARWWAGRRPC